MTSPEVDAENSDGTLEAGEPKMQGLKIAALVFIAVVLAEVTAPFIVPLVHDDRAASNPAPNDEAAAEAIDPADLAPAIYTPLDPPLLANFTDEDGTTRYLQLGLQVMARDQATIDGVKQHAPALRNAFLFLIANHTYAEIATREGKERIRAEMLEETRSILLRNGGKAGVEEIYFTSFIIQ